MDEPATPEAAKQATSLERDAFRVGDWLVEPSLNLLTRGEERSQLQPRVMDVLVFLARRSGDVVSKNEILDAVWQQEHVADSVLANAVASLRSELGDDARRPRYIATIAKRGYRLLPPVEPVDRPAELSRVSAGEPQPEQGRTTSRRAWAVAAVAVAAALAAWLGLRSWQDASPPGARAATPPRIVVIPFENLGQPDDDHIAAGFTEEITHRLARVGSLHVISRTTALNYDRSGKTTRQIGRDLDVDYVLEGSVRWQESSEGDASFRVTPQLIRAADDSHLWSATYDRSPEELFAVQSEISQRIVDELNLRLYAAERAAVHASPMDEIAVYQLYLAGCNHLLSGESADYLRAIDLFEQVIEREPDFAPAHARLSEAHGLLVHFLYDTSAERLGAARASVERACELAPDLPEVHRALGLYYYRCEHDLERALEELTIAREQLPNDSDVVASIGYIRRRQGRWEESLSCLSTALDLDPLNSSHLWNQASTLSLLRRFAEAEQLLDRAIAVAPGMPTPHFLKVSNTLRWTGDVALAREVLASSPPPHETPLWQRWSFDLAFIERRWQDALEIVASSPDDTFLGVPNHLQACSCLVRLGRPTQALEHCTAALRALEEREQTGSHDIANLVMAQAQAYALLGQHDEAIRQADRAFEIAEERGDAAELSHFGVARARIAGMVGEADVAIEQIEHWLSVPSFLSLAELAVDPVWDPIRDQPGFQRLISQTPAE